VKQITIKGIGAHRSEKKKVSSLFTYHVIDINNQNNNPCKLKYIYY